MSAKFNAFPGRFAFENAASKENTDLVTFENAASKENTDLVTIIAFHARNLSKISMLQFMS